MLINPLMLAWTFGAVLPVVVHLLSRSRYRTLDWGAMMFLTGAEALGQYTGRFRQWFLLFIRSMLVGLLAVALARPVLVGKYAGAIPAAGLTTGGRATVVIIVDDSASMGYTRNGKTRLDQAREVALQILTELKPGDMASLLLAGGSQDSAPSPPTEDLQPIASTLSDLAPGNGEADFADALNRAGQLLDHASTSDREIYVVCDRQALSWRRVLDKAFGDSWNLARIGAPVPSITVFPVGGYESDNLSIESIRVVESPVIRDQPAELEIRVRNFGNTAESGIPLSVWSAQRSLAETTVTVPALASRSIRIPVRFTEAGSLVVSAAVKTTGLTFDDRLDCAVEVIDPIRVLLISGDDPPGIGAISASVTTHLQSALAPLMTAGKFGVDPVSVTADYAGPWPALSRFNVVVLADTADLNTDQVRDLEQFVYDGGSVWFAPGHRVIAEQYNQLLYRGDSGIFPAALTGPTPADAPVKITVQVADHQHPIFRSIADVKESLAGVVVNRFFSAIPRSADAKMLAAYSSGKPFLVESTSGRGHVLMMTTALEDGWTNLPFTSAMQPLVQSVVRYLSAVSQENRNLQLHQPIVVVINGLVEDRSATVQLIPGGRREPVMIKRLEERSQLRFTRTDSPGIYRLRYRLHGIEKTINFVITGSRIESDLTPLSAEQWQLLQHRLDIERIEPTLSAVTAAVGRARGGREIWIDLLGGVLVLFVVETVLARLWSIK